MNETPSRIAALRDSMSRAGLSAFLVTEPGNRRYLTGFTGSAGLFGVVLNVGSRADAPKFFDGLHHFGIGFSWGGYESLAIPTSPEKLRRVTKFALAGMSIRLSIGLEDPDDLIADLDAALGRMRG